MNQKYLKTIENNYFDGSMQNFKYIYVECLNVQQDTQAQP